MHHSGIQMQLKSTIFYNYKVFTEYLWEFHSDMHCGIVVNMPMPIMYRKFWSSSLLWNSKVYISCIYKILTDWFLKFISKLHCGIVVKKPISSRSGIPKLQKTVSAFPAWPFPSLIHPVVYRMSSLYHSTAVALVSPYAVSRPSL